MDRDEDLMRNIGTILGALAGPPGAAVGGAVGSLIGMSITQERRGLRAIIADPKTSADTRHRAERRLARLQNRN